LNQSIIPVLFKKMRYSSIILFCLVGILTGCMEEKPYFLLKGKTLGYDYQITVKTEDSIAVRHAVDSILHQFEAALSIYNDSSALARFNHTDSIYCPEQPASELIAAVYAKSREIYQNSNGAFNPAVEPLLEYYGFDKKATRQLEKIDSNKVASLLQLVHFDSIQLTKSGDELCLTKTQPGMSLDFNALSPGLAVDKIGNYLEDKGMRNYIIKIGQSVRALGLDHKNKGWIVNINKPEKGIENEVELPLLISKKSLVTNGNYLKSYEAGGNVYSHIINPFTGVSEPGNLLSVTVISDQCIDAGGYATAFMVMGLNKSLELLEQLKDIEACFIYDTEGDGIYEYKVSPGFSKYYLHNEQK